MERQEYSRNIVGKYLPRTLYADYVPAIFLGFPVLWFPIYSLYPKNEDSQYWYEFPLEVNIYG